MKIVLGLLASIVLLGACAQGGPSGGGSVTMYGTIDEGITFHSK